jgi:thymidine phosphorylase
VRALGIAVVELGGGRVRESDAVDHAVGLTEVAGLGERVGPGERPLALVHARKEGALESAAAALRTAFTIGDGPVPATAAGAGAPPVIEAVR